MTIRQSARGIPRLFRHLEPTFHLASVAAIDAAFVARHDIRGIIWDVDGTLMGCRHNGVAPQLQHAFCELLASTDIRHVVLSNCDEIRFAELGRIFAQVPVLRGYQSSEGPVFRRLIGTDDRWMGRKAPLHLQPIRKPSAALVEFAVRELGLAPAHVVMVGDQYLTDIAAAGLAGVRSIKVETLEPQSFPVAVRLLQQIDRGCYRLRSVLRGRPTGSARRRRAPNG